MDEDQVAADEQSAVESKRDDIDERVANAGWGAATRLVFVRLGTAASARLQAGNSRSERGAVANLGAAARWAAGALLVTGVAYAHTHGAW